MKKLILLILFLINMGIVYGQADIALVKDTYLPGETFQAEIFITEKPLREFEVPNIFLELNSQRISIAPILINLEKNHYFVYFDLVNMGRGNYDFGAELLYNVNGILKDIPVKKSFNIIDGNGISVRPPFVKLDAINAQQLPVFAKITLENKNDVDIDINIEGNEFSTLSRDNINLQADGSRLLYIYPDDNILDTNRTNVSLLYSNSTYIIPIFIFSEQPEAPDNVTGEVVSVSNESLEQEIELSINFLNVKEINKTLKKNRFLIEKLRFANFLDKDIAEVNFSLSEDLNKIIRLNQSRFYNVKSNSINEQVIFINERRNAIREFYYGNLTLIANNYSTNIPVYLYFPEEVQLEETFTVDETEEGVIEEEIPKIAEEIAEEDEEYLEHIDPTLDIREKEVKSNTAFTIVLIIFILVIAISIFFVFKYRK